MNPQAKRELENRLIAMGGKGIMLEDGEMCTMFAHIIEDFPGDKHWFYRGMLNECEPAKRRDMYYSLKPRFSSFQPLPLATYLAQISEEAGAMVSHRVMRVEGNAPDAIVIGNEGKFRPDNNGSETIIRLTCSKCTRFKLFVGDTIAGALIKARNKGWVRDKLTEKEICPKCPAVRELAHA